MPIVENYQEPNGATRTYLIDTDGNVTPVTLAELMTEMGIATAQHTTAGGAPQEDITIAGVTTSTKVFVQLVDNGTNNVSVATAFCTANTVSVVFSADPGNDAIINILLM